MMACCAGDSVRGAIPGFKFGKPLKENFHDKKMHPYIDNIMKYTVTKKERIRHPSGVKPKDLDRLRKIMQKPSDGLDLKKEGITGAQGMAIIKEILVKLPTPLLGKSQSTATLWMKACKKVNTQPSSTSWTIQDLTEVNKLFKEAYVSLEPSNQLMLKYLIAFIRILSQHPDTHVVRPKQAQAMVKYYTTAVVDSKTSNSDFAILAKGMYFLVDNPEDLFGANLDDLIVPLKGYMSSRASGIEDEVEDLKRDSQQKTTDTQQLLEGLQLKDFTLIKDGIPSSEIQRESVSLGSISIKTDEGSGILNEQGDFKSKLSGLDLDDPNYTGYDIWTYLVENVQQQVEEFKATMRNSSTQV